MRLSIGIFTSLLWGGILSLGQAQSAPAVRVFDGAAQATVETKIGKAKVGMGRYILIGPEAEARAYAETELKLSPNDVRIIIAADEESGRKLFDTAVQGWQQQMTQKLGYKFPPGSLTVSMTPRAGGAGTTISGQIDDLQPKVAPKPASTVHVLLACDTDAKGGIKEGVAVDLKMMESFFSDAFRERPGMCKLVKLTGKEVTAQNILDHYRGLKTTDTATLVFYYSGHGHTTDKQPKHHQLALTHGPWLGRADLVAEMTKRPHQCVILLTDCCSNTTDIDDAQIEKLREKIRPIMGCDPPGAMPSSYDPRTVEWLFLRHAGTIDLTAATPLRDQMAWVTDEYGGFFTYSLVRVLRTDVNQINKWAAKTEPDKTTWPLAFGRVQRDAAWMSLGRAKFPGPKGPVSPADRDVFMQWAYAFSFH